MGYTARMREALAAATSRPDPAMVEADDALLDALSTSMTDANDPDDGYAALHRVLTN